VDEFARLTSSVVAPLVDDYAEIVEGFDNALDVAPNLWACTGGNFMSLFDGNYAAIGPGIFRNCVEGGGKVGHAYVQIATACADRSQHSTNAEVAGVGIRDDYMKGCHCSLHSDVRIFPEIEALYGHVAGLRGRGDELHLLAGEISLLLMFGGECVRFGDVGDGGDGGAGTAGESQ